MLDGYFRKLTLVVMWKRSESEGWVRKPSQQIRKEVGVKYVAKEECRVEGYLEGESTEFNGQ